MLWYRYRNSSGVNLSYSYKGYAERCYAFCKLNKRHRLVILGFPFPQHYNKPACLRQETGNEFPLLACIEHIWKEICTNCIVLYSVTPNSGHISHCVDWHAYLHFSVSWRFGCFNFCSALSGQLVCFYFCFMISNKNVRYRNINDMSAFANRYFSMVTYLP